MVILNRPWFAILVPALVGFAMAALCVRGFQFYGWVLFLALPVAVSVLSAFCFCYRRPRISLGSAYGISVLSLLCLGALILMVAMDGLICLLMALPLALALGLVGAMIGREFGQKCSRGVSKILPLCVIILFPGLVAFERTTEPPNPVREVVTTVTIAAPIQRVWRTVVAFPKISAPIDGIFRLGIAYPIEARIDGHGVGAIRHCVFSTGAFIEPITRWDEPTLLAFDVAAFPPPLRELSIYEDVEAPHLHGQMVSKHGQFHLIEHDGRVVLEGTTWYTHTLSPQWYWGPISDYMIHSIHERVLNHIKHVAEQG